MGRKTKAQKIIAELRRKVKLAQSTSFYPKEQRREIVLLKNKEDEKPRLGINNSPNGRKNHIITSQNQTIFLKKDLLRTFLLTMIIVSLEFILYLLFESSNNKILKNFLP